MTREFLNWEYPPFEIPNEVYEHFRKSINKGETLEKEWDSKFDEYQKKYPSEGAELNRMLKGQLPENWDLDLPSYTPDDKGLATRKHSQICLGALGPNLPELIGGSADLTHSNYTDIQEKLDRSNLIVLKKDTYILESVSMQWQPYLMELHIIIVASYLMVEHSLYSLII